MRIRLIAFHQERHLRCPHDSARKENKNKNLAHSFVCVCVCMRMCVCEERRKKGNLKVLKEASDIWLIN